MAKLLTPLNQAALKAEDFSKIERENKEISVSYDRGFFHHVKKALGENKIAAVCLVILCVIITGALMAPLSSVDPDYMDVMNKMAGPSREHWFGTDELGRDSFTRALYGSRVSLLVGFATMVVSVTAGTCVGAVSGYAGGKIDIILMRIVDMFQSVPSLLMIIVIFSFVPNNMVTLVLMLALFSWTGRGQDRPRPDADLKGEGFCHCGENPGRQPCEDHFKAYYPEHDDSDHCGGVLKHCRSDPGRVGLKLSGIRSGPSQGVLGKHAPECPAVYPLRSSAGADPRNVHSADGALF